MFVVNLAICDFFMMVKTPLFIYNSFNRGFATGHLGCQIFAFIGSLTGIGAGVTNACIAYDRYTTIAKPFDGKLTRTKALFMIMGVWIYAVPWGVLPLLEFWGRFVPEGYLTSCSFDYLTDTFDNHMFVAVIFTFSYVLPMSLIIYYYSQIVSHVINHEKTLREQVQYNNFLIRLFANNYLFGPVVVREEYVSIQPSIPATSIFRLSLVISSVLNHTVFIRTREFLFPPNLSFFLSHSLISGMPKVTDFIFAFTEDCG